MAQFEVGKPCVCVHDGSWYTNNDHEDPYHTYGPKRHEKVTVSHIQEFGPKKMLVLCFKEYDRPLENGNIYAFAAKYFRPYEGLDSRAILKEMAKENQAEELVSVDFEPALVEQDE